MSKIGFVGLGKLGLPVAYTFASKGHEVHGYDINPDVYEWVDSKQYPFKEEGFQELVDNYIVNMHLDMYGVIENSDMIFVPIQTPHDPKFEGITPLPDERVDFEYEYLRAGIEEIAKIAKQQEKHIDLVIISTVLPGTIKREIKPVLNKYTHLVYEPMFIAMGTVVQDVLNPEFVLCGVDEPEVADRLEEFYKTIHDKPLFRTDINTAEGIKVFYNTFISTKIALANLYGEMAHKLDMRVDDIYEAISLADDRLISMKYLKAGVGDGGGCHPRDNIALSYVARKYNMSFDFFEAIMLAREKHMKWIGELAQQEAGDLPIFILGAAFKPETNLITGSPAVLLSNLINATIITEGSVPTQKGCYIIGVKHEEYATIDLPEGSVVIDPFRYRQDQKGVRTVRIGE